MRANPEPYNPILIALSHRTVTLADARRVNGKTGMYRLEAQTWMPRIAHELPVCFSRLFLDQIRQFCKCLAKLRCGARFHSLSGSSASVFPARSSAIASAASLANASWVRAKVLSHRVSSSSSSRIRAAIASCSRSGKASTFLTARSSNLVIGCSPIEPSHSK